MKPLTLRQIEFIAFDLFEPGRLEVDDWAYSVQYEAQCLWKALTTGESIPFKLEHFRLEDTKLHGLGKAKRTRRAGKTSPWTVGDEIPRWKDEAMEYESRLFYGEPF